MVSEFKDLLLKVISLRSVIGYNGLVFMLKKTPVIGNILPDRLYQAKTLKALYWALHLIKEIFKLFIGKILGLGLIYCASFALKNLYMDHFADISMTGKELYTSFALSLFLLYAACGALINTNVFRCTTEKEYLVFMLRIDAKKLNMTLFAYDLLKLAAGYLIAGIIGLITGAPVLLVLGLPVLALSIKFMAAGAQAFIFRSKNKRHKPMRESPAAFVTKITLITLMAPFIVIFIAAGYYVPLEKALITALICLLLGIPGFLELRKFDQRLNRRALKDNIVKENITVKNKKDKTQEFKKIKAKGSVDNGKQGFEYLNSLFFKRHGKLIYIKPVVFTAMVAVIAGILIYIFIASYARRFGDSNTVQMVIHNLINMITFKGYEDTLLPADPDGYGFLRNAITKHMLLMLIPVTIADVSFKATQAMYINCDSSLMTYNFFKKSDKIMELFDIRFKKLIKINLAPVIALGLFCDLILFATGGQVYPFQYLVTLVIPVLISAVNSLIWLALYYLFQPFTTTAIVKGGAYFVARFFLSLVAGLIFWIPLHSLILTVVLVVFTALFTFGVRKIVARRAPETWKIKV